MPIDATEFDEYLQFANELADAAAGAILPHFRARYPQHGILGEEEGRQAGTGGFTWVSCADEDANMLRDATNLGPCLRRGDGLTVDKTSRSDGT